MLFRSRRAELRGHDAHDGQEHSSFKCSTQENALFLLLLFSFLRFRSHQMRTYVPILVSHFPFVKPNSSFHPLIDISVHHPFKPPRSEDGSLRGLSPQAGLGGSPIVTPTALQKARSAIKRKSGSEASPDSSNPSLKRREAKMGV